MAALATRMALLAGGLFFLMVGLSIAIAENPTYEEQITPLYVLVTIAFYGFVAAFFVALLLAAFDFLNKSRKR